MSEPIQILLVGEKADPPAAVRTALETEVGRVVVETASTVSDGMERLAEGAFDCVVSGYELPRGDGIEFLEAVREAHPGLPFVLYTSNGDEYVASDAIAAGVTEYVPRERGSTEYSELVESVAGAVEASSRPVDSGNHLHRDDEILKAVPGCVVELDSDGQFIYANQRAEDVLGLERSEVTNRTFNDPAWQIRDLSGNPIPDEELPYRQVWDSEEPLDGYHHAIQWPDGSRTVLSVSGVPMFDDNGEIESVVFSLNDVTEQKRRERELQRFQQIVEHLDDVATIIDPDGTIEYVSPAVERVLGFDQEELVGADGFSYQPPETREAVEAGIERVLEAPDEPRTVQTKFQRADGSWVWIESTLRNRLDDDVIDGILVSSRDITERLEQRERIQDRERQLSQLHAATRDLLAAETPEEAAAKASEAAAEILDLPLNGIHHYDETENGLVPTAVSPESRDLFDEVPVIDEGIAWNVYQQGEERIYNDLRNAPKRYNPDTPVQSEMYLPLGDNGVFLISATETNAFETTDVEFARILAANTEAALNRITKEQQLRSRERELEQQNEQLEEFASVVSHDLRNPLNVASGRLDLVRTAGTADQDPDHLDAVERAHERMEALIDDLLTLASQGDAVDEMETVDLAALARECWQTVESDEATIVTETDRTIRGDRSRLKQLLENLVRNAIEHGGSDVTVRIGDVEDGFFVADDGPGIPESERDQALEAGYSTNSQGTGFGLAIVDRIVQAHGWNVHITDSDAGGARFEITGVEDGR